MPSMRHAHIGLLVALAPCLVGATTLITFKDTACQVVDAYIDADDTGLCQNALGGVPSFLFTAYGDGCVVTLYAANNLYCGNGRKFAIIENNCINNSTINQYTIDGCDDPTGGSSMMTSMLMSTSSTTSSTTSTSTTSTSTTSTTVTPTAMLSSSVVSTGSSPDSNPSTSMQSGSPSTSSPSESQSSTSNGQSATAQSQSGPSATVSGSKGGGNANEVNVILGAVISSLALLVAFPFTW